MKDEEIYSMIYDIENNINLLNEQIIHRKQKKRSTFIPGNSLGYVSPNADINILKSQISELKVRKKNLLKLLEENHNDEI